jgi:hypothetical protein
MILVITNIYNKKTKGPTLMKLFTATRKVKKILQLEMINVWTTGDTAHIDTIFKFFTAAMIRAYLKNSDAPTLTRVW